MLRKGKKGTICTDYNSGILYTPSCNMGHHNGDNFLTEFVTAAFSNKTLLPEDNTN